MRQVRSRYKQYYDILQNMDGKPTKLYNFAFGGAYYHTRERVRELVNLGFIEQTETGFIITDAGKNIKPQLRNILIQFAEMEEK